MSRKSKNSITIPLAKKYVLQHIIHGQFLNLSEIEINALVNEAKHDSRKNHVWEGVIKR